MIEEVTRNCVRIVRHTDYRHGLPRSDWMDGWTMVGCMEVGCGRFTIGGEGGGGSTWSVWVSHVIGLLKV